ncbi:MAG: putative serine/threonine protein kinase [Deltaproteobacteria bacterium]|nr:putative serine/threonine protein kinase [Deltaproteobacteria bacterium]
MDEARERAYERLMVANSSPTLPASDVGYIELVSSPDPRIAPTIFALENTKVRVGRFSTAGTYATSSDVFVAVSDDAAAISPMNTMFEHIDGAFHAFDTRSANGTYVNGEQIRKRRRLSPGDVIDLGGVPDDAGILHGNARVVFLGLTAPAGRDVRRAPMQTQHTWQSPRGGVAFEIDSWTGGAHAIVNIEDREWRSEALDTARAVRQLGSPQLPPSALGVTGPNVVGYLGNGPLTRLPVNRTLPEAQACAIVADLCEAVATCHAAQPRPIVVGPFVRGLVWLRSNGGAVLYGAGLSRVAFQYDAGLTGRMMTPLHFRRSPEEIMGQPIGAATDVFFLAYFWCELVTGREPYPTGESFRYLEAVRGGQPTLPAGAPPVIEAALIPRPERRPSLAHLGAALRALARS